MKATIFRIFLIGFLTFLPAGCNQVAAANTIESPTHPPVETATIAGTPTIPVTPREWDDMPQDPPLPNSTNPGLRALIEESKADLAQRLSVQASQIKAIETSEVVWPDTSLGCPQSGIAYAQILTPGYLIMLAYSGSDFEYHVDVHGTIAHCENPTPPISAIPADTNP